MGLRRVAVGTRVHVLVIGGHEHDVGAAQVVGIVGLGAPGAPARVDERAEGVRDLGRDDGDGCLGGQQPLDLPGGDGAPAHDERGAVLQDERDGIRWHGAPFPKA